MYSHIRLYRSRGISPDVSSWYAVDAAALHGLTYDLNQLAVSRTIVDDLLIRIGGLHSVWQIVRISMCAIDNNTALQCAVKQSSQ